MSGKSKSIYLIVTQKGQLKSVLNKVFFNAKEYNAYVKSEEFLTNYPPEKFTVFKDTY